MRALRSLADKVGLEPLLLEERSYGLEDPRRFVEVGYSTGFGLRLRLWWAGL